MATTWTTESNTQAISTVSTIDTTTTLDDRKSFIIKNSAGINRFQVENATGNATIAGDIDIGAKCSIVGTMQTGGNIDVGGQINLGSNSYMTLTDNEIDVSSGDLTLDAAGNIYLDAAATRVTGVLAIDGNKINSYGGLTAITMSAQDVTIGRDLNVARHIECTGEIIIGSNATISGNSTIAGYLTIQGLGTFSSGIKLDNNTIYASDGGSTITLDTSDNVTIAGNLTVSGNTITSNKIAGSAVTIDASGDISLEAAGGDIYFKANSSDTLIMTTRMSALHPQVLIEEDLFVGDNLWINGNKIIALDPNTGDIELQNLTSYDGDFTVDGSIIVNKTVNIVGSSAGGLSLLWANYTTDSTDRMRFNIRSYSGTDVEIGLYEGVGVKWVLGNDATGGSSDDLFCIGTSTTFSANKFELDTSGNLKLHGQFACNGASPAAAPDYSPSSYSENRTITGSTSAADTTDVLATLVTDLIAIGILQ